MVILNVNHLEDRKMAHQPHIPVMAHEVTSFLTLRPEACFLDCTLGLGGHAALLAKQLGPQGRLVGIDRDKESLAVAEQKLKSYPCQHIFVHDDFRHIDTILASLHITKVDGILMDLGISSFQLADSSRGFSFQADGPLDMRINQESFVSAYDLINSLSERELSTILKNYGQERWHHRIARYLVEQRAKSPIQTTRELRDAVLRAMPRMRNRQKIDPATRTFQAFRIAVNRELESLEMALSKIPRFLKPGARLCVIAFHSLEDRIVKQKMRTFSHQNVMSLVVKKPLRPTQAECALNPRARSARLRVAQKV